MKLQIQRIGYSEYVYRFKFGKTHGFSFYIDWPTVTWED